MRSALLILAIAACSKPAEPTKQTGSATPVVAVDAGSAAVAKPSETVKVRVKRAPPSKQHRADLKKHMQAGWALQKAKKWAEAVPEFEAALVAVPADPRALTELGWSAMNAGDFVKARKADEHALLVAIDKTIKAAGYYNLGVVQEKTGDKDGALKSYIASLALRPNKTVMEAVGKLGASPAEPPAMCTPGEKPCDCVSRGALGIDSETSKCEESKDPAPVKGFHVYTLTNTEGWKNSYEFLFDEAHHYVTRLAADAEFGRHYERTHVEKLEEKTIAGHRVLWIETSSKADATYTASDDGMDLETLTGTTVTICVVGDATVATRCPLQDVPLVQSETHEHSAEGGATTKATETTLSVTLGDTGVVTIKLLQGPSDAQIDALVGPHKLW